MNVDLTKLNARASAGTLTTLDILLLHAAMLIRESAGAVTCIKVTLSRDAFGQVLAEVENRSLADTSNARNPMIAPLYATAFSITIDVASADGVHIYSAQLGVSREAGA